MWNSNNLFVIAITKRLFVIASTVGARQSLDGHANEHSLAMTGFLSYEPSAE